MMHGFCNGFVNVASPAAGGQMHNTNSLINSYSLSTSKLSSTIFCFFAREAKCTKQCAYIVEQNLLKNLSGSDKMLRFSPTHSNTILPGFSPSAILLLLLKKYHYFGLLATPFGPGITFRTFYWTSKVLPFVVHKKLFIATVLRVELQ